MPEHKFKEGDTIKAKGRLWRVVSTNLTWPWMQIEPLKRRPGEQGPWTIGERLAKVPAGGVSRG